MPSAQKKRVLVIGAGGFLGRALIEAWLKKKGWEVFATSRNRKIKIPGATMLYGDLHDATFCHKIAKDKDLIYYAAGAKKNIAFHTKESFDFFKNNVQPLLVFLGALSSLPPASLIYVGSVLAEYAQEEGEMADGYLLGKAASELALKAFRQQARWNVKLVRAAAFYGPGDHTDPAVANFIPAMIRRVQSSDKELLVWGAGTRKLQFIYMDDLVRNLVGLVNYPSNYVLIGSPEAKSVKEIVHLIVQLMDKKLKLVHDLSKPDKATRLFSFINVVPPRMTLAKGLALTIKSMK